MASAVLFAVCASVGGSRVGGVLSWVGWPPLPGAGCVTVPILLSVRTVLIRGVGDRSACLVGSFLWDRSEES